MSITLIGIYFQLETHSSIDLPMRMRRKVPNLRSVGVKNIVTSNAVIKTIVKFLLNI